ncbi:MAG: hypothetical protein PHW26_00410 [Eubacteriales bacterium]|jgi:hypothetical protein|nr:hypothetical protein [Eubacteriales bacterium]
MTDKRKLRSSFPLVRNAFGMDINKQEYYLVTGLSDTEQVSPISCITQGEWANNWVPDLAFLKEETREEKLFT